MNKRILFVDRDKDIRDDVVYNSSLGEMSEFNIMVLPDIDEAEKLIEREQFDGIIVDALGLRLQNVLRFVRKARKINPDVSIVALVGFVDMIVDVQLKENLKLEKVSVVDKLKALKPENIKLLFEMSCTKGFGEEL